MKAYKQILTVGLFLTSYAMMALVNSKNLKATGVNHLDVSHVDSIYQEEEKGEDDVRFSNSEIMHFERAVMKIRMNNLITVEEEQEAAVEDMVFTTKDDKQ